MSVELKRLYNDIYSEYSVRLITDSCFNKHISWVHVIENIDFIQLLHGDELIFNSSLNDETDEYRQYFIDELINKEAGGIIVALTEPNALSEDLISYCNAKQFPLFLATWNTSYLNIIRRFSKILLSNERNETNLTTALKNAIYYPSNQELYIKHFERNDFFQEMPYVITIIGNTSDKEAPLFYSFLHHNYDPCIVYEEANRIILLTVGHSPIHLKVAFESLVQKHPFLHVGVGSLETNLENLYLSFEHALIAFQLAESTIEQNPLCYDELGTYQILCDLKNPERICYPFVTQTLGKLIDYDKENKTSYIQVLKDFFENDCSIVQTANATFFHQNTLKYKVKHIKEILGYDITTNENRTKIMLCLYIMKLSDIESIE